MTLKRRLATAAPAMVHNMMSRRRPLVLRPVSPLKKGSIDAATMMECQKNALEAQVGLLKHQIPKDTSRLAAQDKLSESTALGPVEKAWR